MVIPTLHVYYPLLYQKWPEVIAIVFLIREVFFWMCWKKKVLQKEQHLLKPPFPIFTQFTAMNFLSLKLHRGEIIFCLEIQAKIRRVY